MTEAQPLLDYLDADDDALDAQWQRLQAWIRRRFDREPSIEVILFLVGIQTLGQGFEPKLGKEAKQNLIMEGTYRVFETLGVYRRVGMEPSGHWIWERLLPQPPNLSVAQQEKLLRTAILRYFEDILNETQADES